MLIENGNGRTGETKCDADNMAEQMLSLPSLAAFYSGTLKLSAVQHLPQTCREAEWKGRERGSIDPAPAVTHIRLKMKGSSSNRSGGALRIYNVAISARDLSAR